MIRQIYFFIRNYMIEKLFNNLLTIYTYTFINFLLLDANWRLTCVNPNLCAWF